VANDAAPPAFRRALGWPDPAGEGPAALIGVEQEYQVVAQGRPIDFRGLIHSLPVPGRRLDPGDLNAYRLESGLALTCDEAEAEVASPPLPCLPGFSAKVAAWAACGRSQLEALLPAGTAVAGYSTHLSVSLNEALREPVLDLFLTRFAPALMLLLGSPRGYGMYLRPRPGRLEACGDHVGSHALQAAAALFAGGVRACAAAAGAQDSLPPALAVTTGPATGRFGLYLGRRRAFGFDLYAAGLDGRLPLAGGGAIGAAEHMALCRQSAVEHLGAREPGLAVLDAILAGDLPLPAAAESPPGLLTAPLVDEVQGRGLLATVQRPRFRSRAVLATWDFAVFRLEGRRVGYCCLPRPFLGTFLDHLRSGRLDGTVEAFLAAAPAGRRLQAWQQALAPGLWDELGPPLGLLPDEPEPVTGKSVPQTPAARAGKGARAGKAAAPARPGKPPWARPGKPAIPPAEYGRPAEVTPPPAPLPPDRGPRPPEPAPPTSPPLPPRPLAIAGAIGAVVAVFAVIAVAVGGVFQGPPGEHAPTATSVPAVSDTAAPAATTAPGPTGPAGGETPPATVKTGTETPRPGPTATPSPAVAPAGGETTPQAASSATPAPTETAVPTETPRPTATPTRTLPSPTPTCGPPGTVFACTPTPKPPTATPTRTPIIVPPTD